MIPAIRVCSVCPCDQTQKHKKPARTVCVLHGVHQMVQNGKGAWICPTHDLKAAVK